MPTMEALQKNSQSSKNGFNTLDKTKRFNPYLINRFVSFLYYLYVLHG